MVARAADDTATPPAQPSDSAATPGELNPMVTPNIETTPNPSDNGGIPAATSGTALPPEDETPPLPLPQPTPEATPEPAAEVEAPEDQRPLPGATSAETIANAIPLPANPALEQQFTDWDLANVESPLFLNAAIDDFGARPFLITDNLSVRTHMSLGTYYDGNIFLKSDGGNSDLIARFAPGLTLTLGNDESIFYLMADYTVGLNYYIEHANESTADQDFRSQFQWSLPKTVIGVNLDVSSDTGPDVDVSDRVRRTLYFGGATMTHTISDKTSWELSGDYTRSEFAGLITSSQYEGNLFYDYEYSPKTQLGLGGGAGYLSTAGAPGQVFEQANFRTTYRATGKLTLIGQAGLDVRQLRGMGGGDSLTPIFVLEGAWTPREGTEFALTGQRSIYASAILNDQNYTATSIDVSVRQRITDVVDVSLAVGYVNSDYTATTTTVNATREDNYYYIRPAVEWKALSWLGVGIFYEYSEDDSTGGQASTFSRDRGGVDIAILF